MILKEKFMLKFQDANAAFHKLHNMIIKEGIDFATHYHATYVRPAWAKTKTKTTRIDRHIFYRWEK